MIRLTPAALDAAANERAATCEAALKTISDNAPETRPSLSLYLRAVDYSMAYGAYQQAEIARKALQQADSAKAEEGGG